MTISSEAPIGGPARSEVMPLVEDYFGLANALARRFAGRGEDMDDLIQVALVGLVKARNRCDPEMGAAFTAFATTTIMGELKRHFRDRRWLVHTSRGTQERFLQVRDCLDQLTQKLGRSPTVSELATATGLSEEHVVEAQEVAGTFRPVRLDGPLASSDAGPGDRLSDSLGGIDHLFDLIEHRVMIRPLLARLSDRERRILDLRFGCGLSQGEIARHIGVSQMHVSRLLRSTLQQLREWLEQ